MAKESTVAYNLSGTHYSGTKATTVAEWLHSRLPPLRSEFIARGQVGKLVVDCRSLIA